MEQNQEVEHPVSLFLQSDYDGEDLFPAPLSNLQPLAQECAQYEPLKKQNKMAVKLSHSEYKSRHAAVHIDLTQETETPETMFHDNHERIASQCDPYEDATFEEIFLSVSTKPNKSVLEEANKIKEILRNTKNGYHTNTKQHDIYSAVDHLLCAEAQQWLNDCAINEFQDLMWARQNALAAKSKPPNKFTKCYFANSFIITGLLNPAQTTTAGTFKKCAKIFEMDRAFFPVHDANHWCLVVVDFKTKTILWVDSFNSQRLNKFTRTVKWFLEAISKENSLSFHSTEWKTTSLQVPQQQDSINCGVYLLLYEIMLSMDYWPTQQDNLTSTQLTELREKFAASLLCKSFLAK